MCIRDSIHSPQNVGKGMVRYCGTPLKYSFSETDQEKSITVVEMEEKGTLRIRLLPLKPFRDMRKLRGTYMELTARSFYRDMNCEDYIQVTLTDEDDVPDVYKRQVVSGILRERRNCPWIL